jgi:integrase
MPRKAQWPPKVQNHKASGRARVRVGGVDYYLGRFGSPEAERAYAALVARLADGERPAAGKPHKQTALTVAACCRLWLDGEGARRRPKELDHYRRALAVLLRVAGRKRAADFGAGDLEDVRREMARRWCRNRCNRQVVRLRTVWRWLERHGYAPRGSYEHLRTLPGLAEHDPTVRQTAPVRPCSWRDLAAVCRRSGKTVRAMLLLGWYSGMRPGEVCSMRAAEIDRTGAVWAYRPATHKGAWRGQDRVVMLGPVCQRVLAPFLAGRRRDYLFCPSDRCRKRTRQRYTAETFSRAVARAAARAGVRLHFYQLRHAYRVRVTRAGNLDQARAAMGHTSVGTTNGYARGVDAELARQVAERLG